MCLIIEHGSNTVARDNCGRLCSIWIVPYDFQYCEFVTFSVCLNSTAMYYVGREDDVFCICVNISMRSMQQVICLFPQ